MVLVVGLQLDDTLVSAFLEFLVIVKANLGLLVKGHEVSDWRRLDCIVRKAI